VLKIIVNPKNTILPSLLTPVSLQTSITLSFVDHKIRNVYALFHAHTIYGHCNFQASKRLQKLGAKIIHM